MRTRVKIFAAAVILTAVGLTAVVVAVSPRGSTAYLSDSLILCALAIAGEMLAFTLPNRAIGSVGFIPYFAAAVLVPAWPSVFAVAVVRAGIEMVSDRETIKRLFNIATQTFMEAVAILCYLALGGSSLLHAPNIASLPHIAQQYGLAAMGAFTLAFFINNFLVFVVIALASGRSVKSVVFESSRATFVVDLLTSPLVFVFAWVYAAFSALAAAALWVPILGLRQVHRINLELERTNEELLELMVKSLEARDPYTSGHSRRVHHYSTIIARAIGLSDRQIEEVGHAALLHDVGKIYEKYAPVLSKQDKLTPEEWAIIKDHPADGANLVATMSRLRGVVPAIRHHHENWDGTGYPDGLAGEMIPLASRIIRFADTIDAMTTERPYRRPLSESQVRGEVVRCRSTQFDPAIADKLLSSAMWTTLFAPSAGEPRTRELAILPTDSQKAFARSRGA